MPKCVKLQRNTSQRGLLIASYQRLKKDSDRAITPTAEAVRIPEHLALSGFPQAKQLCHLHAQLSLGRSCHRQKKSCAYAHRVALVVSNSLRPCRLAYLEKEMATHSSILAWSNSSSRLAYQVSLLGGWGGGRFSRQEYWSVLANTGCHTLLEHYISCCPSRQLS